MRHLQSSSLLDEKETTVDRPRSVSGGFPSEYPSEPTISPAYSNANYSSSLDDLFLIQNTEGDVSLEWLLAFVEDCLSSTGNCIPPTATATTTIQVEQSNNTEATKPQTKIPTEPAKTKKTPLQLQEFSIPGKARSKRKRSPTTKTQAFHLTTISDPSLLHQAYWLADSELIVPHKMSRGGEEGHDQEEEEDRMTVTMNNKDKLLGINIGTDSSIGTESSSSHGQPRRCTHCLSQRTPQWRVVRLYLWVPKHCVMHVDCGVRYKSGRLLPEYRPAKSPTFVSYKHSNSHKKVMEMRMSISPSVSNTSSPRILLPHFEKRVLI